MSSEYITAARNKIGLARRHLTELNKLREGESSEREDIQLNFEGVIRNGESAGDQLAEAVASTLGLRMRNASPAKVVEALSPESEPGWIDLLREWINTPIVIDAHKRRRDAVHHHYEKNPDKLTGTWILEAQIIGGAPSPYDGGLDVHTYCATYVESLRLVEVVAGQLEAT